MRVTKAQQRVLERMSDGRACIRRGRYVGNTSRQICTLDMAKRLTAKGLLVPIFLEDEYDRWMISDEGQKWVDEKAAMKEN